MRPNMKCCFALALDMTTDSNWDRMEIWCFAAVFLGFGWLFGRIRWGGFRHRERKRDEGQPMNLFIVLLLNLWKFEKLGLVCVFSLSLLSLKTLICFQLTDDDLSAFRACMLIVSHYLMHYKWDFGISNMVGMKNLSHLHVSTVINLF